MNKVAYSIFWAVLLFVTLPVFAQDQLQGDSVPQPSSAADIVANMQSKLNLTQDQLTAVTPIIEKYLSKDGELRQKIKDGTLDKSSIPSQIKELRADENQELGQVLSADQLKRWKKMLIQRRHRHSSESGGEGGGK
jgi:transcriptional accessory protein Tex/SPT6